MLAEWNAPECSIDLERGELSTWRIYLYDKQAPNFKIIGRDKNVLSEYRRYAEDSIEFEISLDLL